MIKDLGNASCFSGIQLVRVFVGNHLDTMNYVVSVRLLLTNKNYAIFQINKNILCIRKNYDDVKCGKTIAKNDLSD